MKDKSRLSFWSIRKEVRHLEYEMTRAERSVRMLWIADSDGIALAAETLERLKMRVGYIKQAVKALQAA